MIPVLVKHRRVNLYESKASLGYKKTEGRRKKIEQGRVVPICNVSFWEAAAEGTPQV